MEKEILKWYIYSLIYFNLSEGEDKGKERVSYAPLTVGGRRVYEKIKHRTESGMLPKLEKADIEGEYEIEPEGENVIISFRPKNRCQWRRNDWLSFTISDEKVECWNKLEYLEQIWKYMPKETPKQYKDIWELS